MAVSINVIVNNVSTVMSFIYCLKINFKKIKKENPFFRQLIKINQYNIYTCSSCSLFNLLSEVIKDYWALTTAILSSHHKSTICSTVFLDKGLLSLSFSRSTTKQLKLSQGVFSEAWKDALVKPLLKNPGLGTAYKNLRPVSNLQFLSKVSEKAVFNQLHSHLAENDLVRIRKATHVQHVNSTFKSCK